MLRTVMESVAQKSFFRFSGTRGVDGLPGEIRLEWQSVPIDQRVYTAVMRFVDYSTDYSELTGTRLRDFTNYITYTNSKFGTNVSINAAISMRNSLVKEKLVKGYPRMQGYIKEITKAYNNKVSILVLSAKYDFPPLNLLKGIFIARGMPPGLLKKIFAGNVPPNILLTGRDLTQFQLASQYDASSAIITRKIEDLAKRNEDLTVQFFGNICQIKTEEQLYEEQMQERGRAYATPDLLFVDNVYLNGKRVYWLDFKNYAGTQAGLLMKSTKEQVHKYNEHWGPGILCYRWSYVEGLNMGDAYLQSAEPLEIEYPPEV